MSQQPKPNKSRSSGPRANAGGVAPLGVRYHTEILDGKLVIRPMTEEEQRAYAAVTPEEKVKRFREWADQPRPKTPILPDDAFRRENLYD